MHILFHACNQLNANKENLHQDWDYISKNKSQISAIPQDIYEQTV